MNTIPVNLNINNRQITMTFDQSSPVHRMIVGELQSGGAYEVASQLFLTRVLRSGDTFVDVGAHIGYFSMLSAAVVGDQGKVIAIEPIDENFQQLENHIAVNGLTHVEAVQTVISDTDGEADIHFNADNDGGHALWDPGEHPHNVLSRQNPRTLRVASHRLATLMDKRGVNKVRLMKIDTEGAEATILESSRDFFINGGVEFMIMEVNISGLRNMGTDIDSLFALARNLGFIICLPQPDGTPPVLLAQDNLPDPRFVYNIVLARPDALNSL